QFENDLVQRTHCGDIPEVRMGEIDGDFEQALLEIERRHELIGGAEEDLPYHPVDTLLSVGVELRVDVEVVPDLVGEEQRRQQYAGEHAVGQVVRGHHHRHRHHHDDIGGERVVAQVAYRFPAEGADRHHDHHRHQRRHRNLANPVAEKHHEYQQHRAGDKC